MWVVWIGTENNPKAQSKNVNSEIDADKLVDKLKKIFPDLVVAKEYVI